ncbi:MAG TPA: retropepsin-like aspartic protease [Planctomycetota bacterium]|nr:retropepsin-like aspartic protease [Planctomycetota bacterium]
MELARRALAHGMKCAVLALAAAACTSPLPRAASVNLLADEPGAVPARFAQGLVIVEASVDGTSVPFLLDTGSDLSAIDARLQERLGLRRAGSAIARGSGGNVSTSLVRATRFEAGPLRAESPVFLLLDLEFLDAFARAPVGGILGLDLLEGLALTIDYGTEEVLLARGGSGDASQGARIPLVRSEGLVGVEVVIDAEHGVPFLLDSGMSAALSLDPEEARRIGVEKIRGRERHVGIAGASMAPIARARTVTLGGRDLPGVFLVLERPAGAFAGAIGGGLLRRYRVTLDLAEGWLALAPRSTKAS